MLDLPRDGPVCEARVVACLVFLGTSPLNFLFLEILKGSGGGFPQSKGRGIG